MASSVPGATECAMRYQVPTGTSFVNSSVWAGCLSVASYLTMTVGSFDVRSDSVVRDRSRPDDEDRHKTTDQDLETDLHSLPEDSRAFDPDDAGQWKS